MRAKAFTLIELLIVVALIMILSAIGVGAFTSSIVKSRDTQRKSDLNQIIKALESFNNDVGRYPNSDELGNMVCVEVENGVSANVVCVSDKLTFRNNGAASNYITIPKDPDPSQKYVYSSEGSSFALYAALQNVADKDLILDDQGKIVADPFGVSCGSVPCNYKITEVGLIKAI